MIVFSSIAIKGSSSPPSRVILTPNEHKEYIHRTQATKSASISPVFQTGNASVCLSHSSRPWILDSRVSDHISGNKNLFSSLTITSPLPMITLANGSQTMAKEIGLASPLPSIPLTFVLYVPDSLFNLLSISKLTRDLNFLITFFDNSVILQDRRTIDIGCEFQGLFYLNSPSSSTACTAIETPLFIHIRLSHPNISKLRVMVPRFSSLSMSTWETYSYPIPQAPRKTNKVSFQAYPY